MPEDLHIKIRNLEKQDYPQLKELMDQIYQDIGGSWPEHTIFKLIDDLPEGQICVVDHDRIIGVALSVQVDYQQFSNPHTYDDLISKRETILNNANGDALYGLDVLIHPDYPAQSEKIAIQFTDESLSGLFDLPAGTHRVPNSQVIISGHQSGGWVGSILGPIGLSLQSAIDSESAETSIQDTEAMLQFKLTEAADAITDELIVQPEFAGTFTDFATPRTPVLKVKTAVMVNYQRFDLPEATIMQISLPLTLPDPTLIP